MIRRITLSGMGLVFFAVPLFVSADTVSDLQAQVQALVAKMAAMNAQAGLPNISTMPTLSSACVSLSHSMSANSTDSTTGGDVTRLQQFLAAQGKTIYPEARVTGFFGPATMRAVQRWQAAHNIVSSGTPSTTGYGSIGARTRAAMACSAAQSAATTSTSNSGAPTIDPSSLQSATGNPTLSGTTGKFSGVDFQIKDSTGAIVYRGSASGAGGRWSNTVFTTLSPGTYTVEVLYTPDLIHSQNITGTLTISSSTNQGSTSTASGSSASATIDASTLIKSATGAYSVTGTASNTSSLIVILTHSSDDALVSLNENFDSLNGLLKNQIIYAVVAPVSVVNGRWVLNTGTSNPSLRATVLVYDAATHALLTTGKLIVNAPVTSGATSSVSGFAPYITPVSPPSSSTPTPTITFTSPSSAGQKFIIGYPYPISWQASGMPNGAFIEFFLVRSDGESYGILSNPIQPSQGSYSWSVEGPVCVPDPNYQGRQTCSATLNPGQYQIVAKVYSTIVNSQPSGLLMQAFSPWITLTGNPSTSNVNPLAG